MYIRENFKKKLPIDISTYLDKDTFDFKVNLYIVTYILLKTLTSLTDF